MNHRDAVRRFQQLIAEPDLVPAIRFLNALSAHRFTAVYYFDGPTLRNLILVDREDASVRSCPDLPVEDSYCVYVRNTADRFVVENAGGDARVEGHPKQPVVQSYCGIPLVDADNTLFGTICHFDFAPIPYADSEVYLLESVAPLIIEAVRARRETAATGSSQVA